MKGTIGPVSQACSSAAAQHAVRPTMSPLSSTLGNHREIPAAAAFHVASAAVGNHTGALPAAVSASVALPLPSSVTTIHKSALLHSAAAANSASQAMPAAPSVRGHAAVHRPGSCSKQQESESEDDSPIRPKCVARSKLLSDSEEEDRIPVKQMGTNAAPSKHDVRQRLSSPRKAPATGAAVSPVKADGPLQKNRVSSSSPISRQDESSDSSTYSDTSSETSSSDRSDSSETSEESGSSESSEGSTSESEDSEEERLDIRKPLKPKRPSSQAARTPPKRAKLQAGAKVRTPDARSRSKSQELSGDEEEGAQIKMGTFDPRNRSTKAKLVAQLLCRWWYVLPEWPPANFDYVTKLNERRLQLVPLEEYEDLDDVDERGFTKVYQISAFPGVFRDPQGRAIDLRPEEGRPCYSNLIKKSEYELIQLVETAIKNQMKSLKESVYDERRTHKKLQMELNEVTKELERFRTREELLKKK